MKRRPSSTPCIFREPFTREQVDPRVKEVWERATNGQKAPFGRLRKAFQTQHCTEINPYGGECPYLPEECALAFLSAVQNSLLPWVEDPGAYFIHVARRSGMERADNKPLARERHREEGSRLSNPARGRHPARSGTDQRDFASAETGHSGLHPQGIQGPAGDRGWEGGSVRGSHARPVAVGALLGVYDLAARQRPADDGKASAK